MWIKGDWRPDAPCHQHLCTLKHQELGPTQRKEWWWLGLRFSFCHLVERVVIKVCERKMRFSLLPFWVSGTDYICNIYLVSEYLGRSYKSLQWRQASCHKLDSLWSWLQDRVYSEDTYEAASVPLPHNMAVHLCTHQDPNIQTGKQVIYRKDV